MKIKARHKLIPAILSLVIATLVMTNATYAWFTMNSAVTANGMQLTVVAPDNLLISATGTADTYNASATSDEVTTTAVLTHASSVDGVTFFYTDVVDPEEGTSYGTYTGGIADFKTAGTAGAIAGVADSVAYFDFTFWVKTTGATAVDCAVSDINITTTAEAGVENADIINAVRFAVLDATTTPAAFTSANVAASVTTYQAVFGTPYTALGEPIEYSAHNQIGEDNTVFYKAISSIATTVETAATQFNPTAAIFTVPASTATTNYIPIVIRVWVEGQDADCINANGGDVFDVEVEFSIAS